LIVGVYEGIQAGCIHLHALGCAKGGIAVSKGTSCAIWRGGTKDRLLDTSQERITRGFHARIIGLAAVRDVDMLAPFRRVAGILSTLVVIIASPCTKHTLPGGVITRIKCAIIPIIASFVHTNPRIAGVRRATISIIAVDRQEEAARYERAGTNHAGIT